MVEAPPSAPRRNWLLHVLQATIAGSLAAILYPVARFLRPRAIASSGNMEVVAPYRVNELRPDAAGNWPPPFNFGGQPCLLIRTPDGEIRAFNAICTHAGCTVEFQPAKSDIFCNCHNGLYDLNGHNVSGPPPRPLVSYKVSLRGTTPGQEEIIVSHNT